MIIYLLKCLDDSTSKGLLTDNEYYLGYTYHMANYFQIIGLGNSYNVFFKERFKVINSFKGNKLVELTLEDVSK